METIIKPPSGPAGNASSAGEVERPRTFMTGTQALVRLAILQRERDQRDGLNTAGFISGYRGSPLGSLDMAAARAAAELAQHHVRFQPGVNEDLAATSVWGTQQLKLAAGAKYDGVFAMWYGKGPGVDRCGDVFKHANLAGSAQHGGVLVVAGDDHAAKSSTTAHQSEQILQACGIPVLYPSSVQEYLDFGIHGFAMSRHSGLWVGMKCVTDIVESAMPVIVDPGRIATIMPSADGLPAEGLNIRLQDPPLLQERRMTEHKWRAAKAYAKVNRLDRIVWENPADTLGIVSAGKAWLDTLQALADLGINADSAATLGIRLYKVGMCWPLETDGLQKFAAGLDEILVVEEKRPFLETQIRDALYNAPTRPTVVGKAGGDDGLLPAHYELDPGVIARTIVARLVGVRERAGLPLGAVNEMIRQPVQDMACVANGMLTPTGDRAPYFCSGCPHNTSTKVPTGSRALAGIGCHVLATRMDRQTSLYTQMGGEGCTWIGLAPFTNEKHVFANLGDGTYFHSGLLAIRAAVAAKVNITYKILFNDAVAMTGGQGFDGPLDPGIISRQLDAEGVRRIVVVTDEPHKYPSDYRWAPPVLVVERGELDAVQRTLRDEPGVTAIIYDQTCASEKRRRRKRHAYPDPAKRVLINEAVCEGCGDCGSASNCLSIEPAETEFGRKRRINQSSCNKDFSCVNGFCPSFVTVEGGVLRKRGTTAAGAATAAVWPALPEPSVLSTPSPFRVLVAGVGGTGVITVGQVLATAAHMQGLGCSVLDMSGLAQKGGPVVSHVMFAADQRQIMATRVGQRAADLVIGCDAVVAGNAESLARMGHGRTRVVLNLAPIPTAEFVRNPEWRSPASEVEENIRHACGNDHVAALDAGAIATALLGDAIATNMFMVGYCWQKGWLPLQEDSIREAITLNGAAVAFNQEAFTWGRRAAHDLPALVRHLGLGATPVKPIVFQRAASLEALVATRVAFLTAYQDARYGAGYRDFVEQVRLAETTQVRSRGGLPLTTAVARYLFKLMAYKDEYEVARLHSSPEFASKVAAMFDGAYKLRYHLAPPLFARRDASGLPIKSQYGTWMRSVFVVLAKLKVLRGTVWDVFGHTRERRQERELLAAYRSTLMRLLPGLHEANRDALVAIASIPEQIRGYGHVKLQSIERAEEREAALIREFTAIQPIEKADHDTAK